VKVVIQEKHMTTKPILYDSRPAEPIRIPAGAANRIVACDPTNPAHRQLIDILQGLARLSPKSLRSEIKLPKRPGALRLRSMTITRSPITHSG
jgi:hypothetical protein